MFLSFPFYFLVVKGSKLSTYSTMVPHRAVKEKKKELKVNAGAYEYKSTVQFSRTRRN